MCLAILLEITLMWFDQVKHSSIQTPKNFVLGTWSIIHPSIIIFALSSGG